MMNFKGQGALEYLLMIGAGIAVAAIVLVFVLGSIPQTKCEGYKSQLSSLCSSKTEVLCKAPSTADIDPDIPQVECVWDTTTDKCILNTAISATDWAQSKNCK